MSGCFCHGRDYEAASTRLSRNNFIVLKKLIQTLFHITVWKNHLTFHNEFHNSFIYMTLDDSNKGNPMQLVTAKKMQEMDRQTIESFGIPGLVLMENAGRGAFEFLCRRFDPIERFKVAVLAGRGNNGGDGFVMARYLMEIGIKTTCYLLSTTDRVQGDAKVNMDLAAELCRHSDLGTVVEIPDTDTLARHRSGILHHTLFIDAILGTGLNSDVRGFFKEIIELINDSPAPVFSVDIPSGLHSDTGRPLGCAVKADATATFAFAKTGHILYPGNHYTGELSIIDIGIPHFIAKAENLKLSLLEKQTIAALLPAREFTSHKGSYGHLLIAAGSTGKTGAAALCANAAMRCGTGLVTLAVPESVNPIIEPMVTEPMTLPMPEKEKGILSDNCLNLLQIYLKSKHVLALGPGIGTQKDTIELVRHLVTATRIPMVLDADALNCIAENPGILKQKKAPTILTPHPGEMARLCGKSTADVQENRLETASTFAADYDTIVILKGAQTIISFPNGTSFISPTGNPGMASGGMGDVLTGMVAGFCAQGLSPENASLAGVFLHGLCGDMLKKQTADVGFLATDMIEMIPKAIQSCKTRIPSSQPLSKILSMK